MDCLIVLDVINVIIRQERYGRIRSPAPLQCSLAKIMMLINSFYGQYMWLKKSQTVNKKQPNKIWLLFYASKTAYAADDHKNN